VISGVRRGWGWLLVIAAGAGMVLDVAGAEVAGRERDIFAMVVANQV